MEDILWKFPHVGQQVFKKLSNKNLAKSKKVARTWESFIINEKFYKQKVHFENKQKEKDNGGRTPLHCAARDGKLLECKLIMDNVEDKNPRNNVGWTPLQFAAKKGHLQGVNKRMAPYPIRLFYYICLDFLKFSVVSG